MGPASEAPQCLCSHPKGTWAGPGAHQLKGPCRKATRQSLAAEATQASGIEEMAVAGVWKPLLSSGELMGLAGRQEA